MCVSEVCVCVNTCVMGVGRERERKREEGEREIGSDKKSKLRNESVFIIYFDKFIIIHFSQVFPSHYFFCIFSLLSGCYSTIYK